MEMSEDGRGMVYFNNSTGEISEFDPSEAYYASLLEDAQAGIDRKAAAGPSGPSAANPGGKAADSEGGEDGGDGEEGGDEDGGDDDGGTFSLTGIGGIESQESQQSKSPPKKGKQAPKVVVNVVCGTDLIPKDSNGLSDPYCVVTSTTDKKGVDKGSAGGAGAGGKPGAGGASSGSKNQTQVKFETLNPTWNEHFVFEYAAKGAITVTVWDKDKVARTNLTFAPLLSPFFLPFLSSTRFLV